MKTNVFYTVRALAYGGGATVPWPSSEPKNKKNYEQYAYV